MGKNKSKSFCIVMMLALVCGLVLQFVMPTSVMAEEVLTSEATSVTVSTFEELLTAFDSTWEAEAGTLNVVLSGNIEQGYGEGDYLAVNAGWTVTLDLAGHILTLRNDGPRGLQNHGTLIVTGEGMISNTTDNTMNESYGLIDNYGGEVVIRNGMFVDFGMGGGATIKNRSGGTVTIESALIHAYGTAGGNACLYSDGDLTVYDGVEMINDATDEKHDGYIGAYAMIVSSGTATIGTTGGNVANPVKITGNRGALGLNSGTVTVNNGVYTGNVYYGMWITNNGDVSDVTIEYAEATGGKYGVYSAVDDGKQDVSDASIEIKDGKYSGGTKAAVAVNQSKSEHSFGMSILGGEFSTQPDDSYLAEGRTVFEMEDTAYPYMVDEIEDVFLPKEIYLTVGEQFDLRDYMNDSARRHGNFGMSDVASLDDFIITATKAGQGVLLYTLKDAAGLTYVNVYEVETADGDASETDADAKAIADYTTAQIAELIKTNKDFNETVALSDGYIDGEWYSGVELVKAALSNGYKLEVMLNTGKHDEEDWEDTEAYEELMAELGEEEAVATIYDGFVTILAVKDGVMVSVGTVAELETPVMIALEIPEEYLQTPEGIKRVFSVIRGHLALDGSKTATRLEATQSGKYLMVETDKFSSFAIAYVDTEEETGIIVPNTGVFTHGVITPASKESYDGLIVTIAVLAMLVVAPAIFKLYHRIQRKIYRGI